MEKVQSTIEINADVAKVWTTMLEPDTYKEWIAAAFPGSFYEGSWDKGQQIRFLAPDRGGTLAEIVECKPFEFVLAKHIAVINADGTEDRTSEEAKSWIGTMESYSFYEKNGKTELHTEMEANPEWINMLSGEWPKALAKLKAMCED